MTVGQGGEAFDYVIVGAGSAGCVIANRLSEDAGTRICLVEAGPQTRHPFVSIPLGMVGLIDHPRLNWRYMSAPQQAAGGRRYPIPRGKMLGGTSSLNGMVYPRGQAADFDGWAALGNPGWSYREVLPYFMKSEDNLDFHDAWHAQSGPMTVATAREPNPLALRFLQAAQELQYPLNPDPNGARQEGFGLRQVNIRDGRRVSSESAFLRPARSRRNLHVVTGSEALKIEIIDKRASAVVLSDGRRLEAHREVVLSAGVIGSPVLLMRSGLGPAEHLRSHGIEVLADLPEVGQNLHDHPSVQLIWRGATGESYGISARGLPGLALSTIRYFLTGKGVPGSNVFEAAGYIRSRPDLAEPDTQLVFCAAFRKPGGTLGVGHGYALGIVGLKPKSRGSITLSGSTISDQPIIDPNLLSDESDLEVLIEGVNAGRRVLSAPAFEGKGHAEIAPGTHVQGRQALAEHIRNSVNTAFHPVGTCAMKPDGVVSGELKVRGVDGLRVADASIMPTITSGNTHAPTVMIGEKCADLIRGRTLEAWQPPADLETV